MEIASRREFVRRMYENGKLTIPKEVRELHDINEGDFVRLQILEVIPNPRKPEARKEEVA